MYDSGVWWVYAKFIFDFCINSTEKNDGLHSLWNLDKTELQTSFRVPSVCWGSKVAQAYNEGEEDLEINACFCLPHPRLARMLFILSPCCFSSCSCQQSPIPWCVCKNNVNSQILPRSTGGELCSFGGSPPVKAVGDEFLYSNLLSKCSSRLWISSEAAGNDQQCCRISELKTLLFCIIQLIRKLFVVICSIQICVFVDRKLKECTCVCFCFFIKRVLEQKKIFFF